MPLYIETNNPRRPAAQFAIGEADALRDYQTGGWKTLWLSASGPELEAIRAQFTGIPVHNTSKIQRWTGEIAHFLARHIEL